MKETLQTFLTFSQEFEIHTEASKLQLGACVSQNGKPVALYLRQLQPAQTWSTTTAEGELLSIVETLKEFRNILLGQKIKVHTDHEDLTCKHFNLDRVMCWRLYIKEYSPELQYIKGAHNVVADALSHLDMNDKPFKDTKKNLLRWMECLAKEPETPDFHPLNYCHF
jgi:RNase H-like domain found in reverse transcriptase